MNSFNSNLKSRVKSQSCCLCVGLDMSPEALKNGGLTSLKDHTFNVIDATRDYAVAYKPNFAFFERWGAAGFAWLEETVAYIGDDYIKIADAKRGDIGNTGKQYAESIFSHFGFDCVTLSPYMGRDSIAPFLLTTFALKPDSTFATANASAGVTYEEFLAFSNNSIFMYGLV